MQVSLSSSREKLGNRDVARCRTLVRFAALADCDLLWFLTKDERCQTREINSRHARRRKFESRSPSLACSFGRVSSETPESEACRITRSRKVQAPEKRIYAPSLIRQIVSSRQIPPLLTDVTISPQLFAASGYLRDSPVKKDIETKKRCLEKYQKYIVTVSIVPFPVRWYYNTRIKA